MLKLRFFKIILLGNLLSRSIVEGILIRPGTIYKEQPIRFKGSDFQFQPPREKNEQYKTQWIYNSKPEHVQPNRPRLQEILMRPFLGRTHSKLRNPYAGLLPKTEAAAHVSRSVPSPVKIRCCVHYSPNSLPQIIGTRTVLPYYNVPLQAGSYDASEPSHGIYGSWASGSGQRWSSQLPETSYNIPFPEYSYTGFSELSGSKLSALSLNKDFGEILPKSKQFEEYYSSTTASPHIESTTPSYEKRKRILRKIKAKLKKQKEKKALAEVPEPFKSWILKGGDNKENNASTRTKNKSNDESKRYFEEKSLSKNKNKNKRKKEY